MCSAAFLAWNDNGWLKSVMSSLWSAGKFCPDKPSPSCRKSGYFPQVLFVMWLGGMGQPLHLAWCVTWAVCVPWVGVDLALELQPWNSNVFSWVVFSSQSINFIDWAPWGFCLIRATELYRVAMKMQNRLKSEVLFLFMLRCKMETKLVLQVYNGPS